MKIKNLSIIILVIGLGLVSGMALNKHSTETRSTLNSLSSGLAKLNQAMISPVFASTPPTAMTAIRSEFFLIGGYPSFETWEALHPDHATEGAPPRIGLLGALGQMIDGMAMIASNNNISTCDAVPATGSFTGTIASVLERSTPNGSIAGTLTFEAPTKSIPAGWTSAGTAYTKRMKFISDNFKIVVEFLCDRSSAFAAMSIPGDSIEGSTRTLNLYWDVQDSTTQWFEMAMKVTKTDGCGTGGDTCDTQLLRVEKGASDNFKLWSSYYAWRETKYQTGRLLMNGSSATGQFTTFYEYLSDAGTDEQALTNGDIADAISTTTYDFQQTTTADFSHRGCVDFDTPTTNPADASDCASYSLAAPAATVYTGSGSPGFSIDDLRDVVANIVTPS